MEPMKSCSQCGTAHYPSCSRILKSFLSDAEEMAYINRERAEIEERISLLAHENARLGRRLNQIQPSTRTLPSETLSEIFRYTYHDISDKRPLFQVSAVCSHWYKTARSSPRLWSILFLKLNRDNIPEEFLRHWFANVGAVPITLKLKSDGFDLYWLNNPLWKDNVSKVRKLVLMDPCAWWVEAPIFRRSFEDLEELELHGFMADSMHSTIPDDIISFGYLTKLSVLTLTGWNRHRFTLPSHLTITTLKLAHINHVRVSQLLSDCQHSLVELVLASEGGHSDESTEQTILPLVALHQLRILKINRFRVTSGLILLFESLNCPFLQRLILEVNYHFVEYSSLTAYFFEILPPTPITFRVIVPDHQQKWITLLSYANRTQELILTFSSPAPHIKHLFQLLTPQNSTEEKFISNLRRLAIRSEDSNIWLDVLLLMMERRRVGLEEPFHLSLVKLEKSHMKMLHRCVERLGEEGCSVKIQPVGKDNIIFGTECSEFYP